MQAAGSVTIAVEVTAEQNEWIESLVDSGEYPDAAAVLRQAFRTWAFERELEEERLRTLYLEGRASGSAHALDMDAFLETLLQEVRDREKKRTRVETLTEGSTLQTLAS